MAITTYTYESLAKAGLESAQYKLIGRRERFTCIAVALTGTGVSIAIVALEIFALHGTTSSFLGISGFKMPSLLTFMLQAITLLSVGFGVSLFVYSAVQTVKACKDTKNRALSTTEVESLLKAEEKLVSDTRKYIELDIQKNAKKSEKTIETKNKQLNSKETLNATNLIETIRLSLNPIIINPLVDES